MNTQDIKRKLTAIFSADVAGYSSLMGEDEAATVKTLEAYKQVVFSLIKQHRGRVIDSPGDNLLRRWKVYRVGGMPSFLLRQLPWEVVENRNFKSRR